MNYQKIDAAMAAALEECQGKEDMALEVFIHMIRPADEAMARFVRKLGISETIVGRSIVTGTLTVQEVDLLTEQPWVRFLRLSQRLRLSE
jgi:hypothetical protein